MFTEKIIPKAFAQEANQAMENLVNSEAKLQQLNTELKDLTTEYMQNNSEPAYYSFLNVDNIYFWYALGGLLLLAIGLLFLLIELKKYQPVREKKVNQRKLIEEEKRRKKELMRKEKEEGRTRQESVQEEKPRVVKITVTKAK